jgi:hypothetical protein
VAGFVLEVGEAGVHGLQDHLVDLADQRGLEPGEAPTDIMN